MNNKITAQQSNILSRCSTTFLISGALSLSLGSLMPYLRESYGFSYLLSGSLLSLHSVGNLISSFLAGILPFHFGRKQSAVYLALLGIAFYMLLVFCGGSEFVLMLAFLCSGLSRGSCTNVNNTLVSMSFPGKAWAMNTLHACFAIGAFFSPFLILFFADKSTKGWVIPTLILAVLCFFQTLIFASIKMPDNRPTKQTKGSDWGFLKLPRFQLVSAIMFFYMCVEQGVNGWLVTYFKDSGYLSASFAQAMASILWLFVLGGRLSCAVVSKKLPKPQLMCLTSAFYAVFFFVLLFSRSLSPIAICTIGVGFFMAGIYPTTMSTIGDVFVKYPLSMSMLLTTTGLGAIIMPSIIGAVADNFGIITGMFTLLVAVVLNVVLIFLNAHWSKSENFFKI